MLVRFIIHSAKMKKGFLIFIIIVHFAYFCSLLFFSDRKIMYHKKSKNILFYMHSKVLHIELALQHLRSASVTLLPNLFLGSSSSACAILARSPVVVASHALVYPEPWRRYEYSLLALILRVHLQLNVFIYLCAEYSPIVAEMCLVSCL